MSMELHITSRRPSIASSVRELAAYRDLLWILAQREISVRYKQTVIGILWVILQPVITSLLFTVIFGYFVKIDVGIPYIIFSFSGTTLVGTLFSNALGRAGLSVIADEKLITKVYFPRATIPLASIMASGFDYVVSLVLLFIVAACYGYFPGLQTLAILPATLLAIAASAGLGTAFAGWTVRYRDFRYVVPFFLQLALYASPVIYPLTRFPEPWRSWFYVNPMCGALDLFRFGITGITPVHGLGVAISTAMALLLFLGGGFVFQRVEQSFADHI
jgi:lipopolysaccharide transport system permease protein